MFSFFFFLFYYLIFNKILITSFFLNKTRIFLTQIINQLMNISLIRFKCLMFKHIPYQDTLPNLKRKIKFSILLFIYILSFVFIIFHLEFFLFLFESFLISFSIYSYDYFTIYCFSIAYFESLLTTCHATVAKESLDRCFTSGGKLRIHALVDWYL